MTILPHLFMAESYSLETPSAGASSTDKFPFSPLHKPRPINIPSLPARPSLPLSTPVPPYTCGFLDEGRVAFEDEQEGGGAMATQVEQNLQHLGNQEACGVGRVRYWTFRQLDLGYTASPPAGHPPAGSCSLAVLLQYSP
jgi:hypothetical protein